MYLSVSGFYSGPNLNDIPYSVICVNQSSVNQSSAFNCKDPTLNSVSDPVTGVLPNDVSFVEAFVDGLSNNVTYDCYVTVELGKVTKCVGPLSDTTVYPGAIVFFDIVYDRNSSTFDLSLQKQVCENLLSLVPLGTCVVDSVVDGGARAANQTSIVSGSVLYNLYSEGETLFDDLLGGSSTVLSTLVNGVVNNISEVSVASTSLESREPTLVPGTPGFVAADSVLSTSAVITWLDGKLGDPEETYTVTCVESSVSTCGDSGVSVSEIPRGNETATVTGLLSNTTYSCWVKAVNSEGEVCASQPVQIRTGYPCTFIPGAAINVAPQAQNCFVASGYYQGGGRMFRDGATPPTCGNTPKTYNGNFNTGSTQDVVVFTSYAPPPGTCVTVNVTGGSCGFNSFLSLWSGEFPITPQTWPNTGTIGNAVFQNDPGSSGPVMIAPFTMPSDSGTFSIVLSTSSGVSSCQYGDIQITYT